MDVYCYTEIKYDFIFGCRCPECGEFTNEDGSGPHIPGDYCEESMLWCNCAIPHRGFRGVLELDYEQKNLYKYEFKDILPFEIPDRLKVGYKWFKIPLIFINRIVNYQLYLHYSDIPLANQDVVEFINSNFDTKIQTRIKKRYKSEKEDDSNLPDEDEYKEIHGEEPDNLFNIAIDCKSYNIWNPKIPYPKNFDDNHEPGMYYEYFDKNNNPVIHRFSDD